MSGPALIKQIEIARTVKAVLSAGLRVGRVEVDHATGRVVVFPEGTGIDGAMPNDWDAQ